MEANVDGLKNFIETFNRDDLKDSYAESHRAISKLRDSLDKANAEFSATLDYYAHAPESEWDAFFTDIVTFALKFKEAYTNFVDKKARQKKTAPKSKIVVSTQGSRRQSIPLSSQE